MKSKKTENTNIVESISYPFVNEEDLLIEVQQHYTDWTDDNEIRKTREGGWDDVENAYDGKLPADWPFISRTTDPRIRTTLLEKNARLTNQRLRGKVSPREGTDIVKARINSALVDYQWDAANDGGSMQTKIANCDLDSRKKQSKFAYVYWREVKNGDKLVFCGNEFRPWNTEECGMDPNCDHIRNARWFQHLEWMTVNDIEANKSLFPGYSELMERIKNGKTYSQNRRDNKYVVKSRQNKSLEDRMGTDKSFPVVPVVTEYRKDKFIIFCPDYNVMLAKFNNTYDHGKIPVTQLRYYKNDGDNLGESEVESVIPLWKAIQAVMCSIMDEAMLKMRPPLKGVEGSFRPETIVYGPEAIWLMDNPNAVTEVESRGDSLRYFQTIYPSLVSAFNTAMGDMSQGISNVDSTKSDKTATEIRQITKQQNSRDQKNQQELAEFIKDTVMMWVANNKQFLFKDPKKQEYILKIIGAENFEYFKRIGMDEMILTPEATQMIGNIQSTLNEEGQSPTPGDLQSMIDAAKVPKHPMITGEDESGNPQFKSKMSVSEDGESAELYVEPEDLEGYFDYIPDMKSMEMSNSEQMAFARMQAIQMLTNPNVLQLLQMQGYQPALRDLMVANFEDTGLNDASRFFTQAQPPTAPVPGVAPQGANPTGGTIPAQQAGGMGNMPQAPTQPSIDQQMAGTNSLQV
jgi:hypothetical protein